LLGWEAGPNDVDAVECCLGIDLRLLAFPRQPRFGDRQVEVLGDVEAVDDPADTQRDLLFPAQGIARADYRCGDRCEVCFRRRQQLRSLARPLLGQQGVAANDQTLSREVLAVHFEQVALVEQ
jgi:hypothetical protein